MLAKAAWDWELMATLLGGMAAVAGIPLTAMVLYLRAIREEQMAARAYVARRLDSIETDCRLVEASTNEIERSYTTKSEWVRENMMARKQLERLTELMIRVQAELEGSRGLATQFVRSTNAIIHLADRLSQRLGVGSGRDGAVGADAEAPPGK